MTNAQVFAAFAKRHNGSSASLTSYNQSNGVTVLVNYNTPIAFIAETTGEGLINSDGIPVFDTRKYSATTSKQQSQAKRACGHYTEQDHDVFRKECVRLGISTHYAR